ncbi:MAG: RAMP superfamily CRISPR-associated protein [Granulosicoccus sp.]
MSGIPQSRKLNITPLSPVHMGTGEDYTPTDYIIEDNALYEFDQRALEVLPTSERQSLNTLLAGKATPDMLKNIQAFFYKNRDWLIPDAINVAYVSDGLSNLYQARVGRAANIESSGRQVQNNLEIQRAAFNPVNRRLYLPGSGLKGAMRTALLDSINQGTPLKGRENNRDLQTRLLKGSFDLDPLRLVQIGDCAWRGPENLNSAEILFAVNRKKHPVEKACVLLKSQAEQKNLNQMLECATPFRFRAFQGLLNIADMAGVKNGQNKLPKMQFSFGDIAAACNRFYRPIFDAETQLLKKRGYLDSKWRQTVQSLLDDPRISQQLENNEAFLLRAGRHSGAESVTLNGVRSIKIMQGKNKTDAWESEARTIWLATGDQQDKRYLRPFGWLLVELTKLDQEPPEWTAAKTLIGDHTELMQQWLLEVRTHQVTLGKKVKEARLQVEQRARINAQNEAVEAQQKAEEETRLAEMSPLERDIEDICERSPDNPAALLFNKLEDGLWPEKSDQLTVANRIKALWEEDSRWNPDFSGKNKKKVQQSKRCQTVLEYLSEN